MTVIALSKRLVIVAGARLQHDIGEIDPDRQRHRADLAVQRFATLFDAPQEL